MKDKLTKGEMKKTTGGGEEIGIGLDAGWECLDCGNWWTAKITDIQTECPKCGSTHIRQSIL